MQNLQQKIRGSPKNHGLDIIYDHTGKYTELVYFYSRLILYVFLLESGTNQNEPVCRYWDLVESILSTYAYILGPYACILGLRRNLTEPVCFYTRPVCFYNN